jgi:hypothetical protein
MSFISTELRESRLFRSETALKTRTTEDIKNVVFLYFVTLSIMKEDFTTAPWAQDYLMDTFKYGMGFTTVRRSDTDLYWGIYIIHNKHFDKLSPKYKNENETEMNRISLPMNIIRPWVKNSIRGMSTSRETFRLLKMLEKSLRITESEYRTLLSAATHWNKLTDSQRAIICTRLLYALKKYARLSEIYPEFEKFIKEKKYLIQDSQDPEQPINKQNALKSILMKGVIGAGVGYMLGNLINPVGGTYRSRIREHYETLNETTSSSIATTVMPLGDVKKRQYAKTGKRKLKYFP